MSDDESSQLTRRELFEHTVLSGAIGGVIGAATIESAFAASGKVGQNLVATQFQLNGKHQKLEAEARVTLLDALRERLDLPGTKKGCDHGQCGACTVLLNGRRVLSCLTLLAAVQGQDIVTIEGLAKPGELHPMQTAFIEHDAFQCGFCTSGQILSAVAFLREPGAKTRQDIQEGMSGNLCRCAAYQGIVEAVEDVIRKGAQRS